MTKIIVFLMLVLPSMFGSPAHPSDANACSCPDVSNVHKTGYSLDSVTYSWDGSAGATQYRVNYYRSEDQYASEYFYTNSTSYNFTNLSAGHYTFYFTAICGGGPSGIVGIEDFVQ